MEAQFYLQSRRLVWLKRLKSVAAEDAEDAEDGLNFPYLLCASAARFLIVQTQ